MLLCLFFFVNAMFKGWIWSNSKKNVGGCTKKEWTDVGRERKELSGTCEKAWECNGKQREEWKTKTSGI